ncbi:MAG: hypothetical protein WC428_02160 [Candidatus Paceibacterota bacterium]|jgi:predicted CopG family antitoxin
MESEELNELYEKRRDLAEKIANYFGNDEPDNNDSGYQDLLTQLERIEGLIDDYIDDHDN